MHKGKKFDMILSLVIAVCLWAYVIGEINPTDVKTFRNIPIKFVNEQALETNDLAVLSTSEQTLNVSISGKRSLINKITSKDIVATVDLSEAAIGKNELRVDVKVPEKTEIDDKSINKVSVVVERRQSKSVDIKVDYSGNSESEDEEPTTVDTSRDTVVVSGAESLVNRVSYAKAEVPAEKVENDEKTIKSKLVAVDKKGNEVSNITLSAESIDVSSVLEWTRTVALEVPVTDNSDNDIDKSSSAPDKIVIKGRKDKVSGIDKIYAKNIDITGINKSSTVDIVPILPEGISISDKSENLVLTVSVKELVSKDFDFNGDDVRLDGLDDSFSADIRTGKITVTVFGKEDDISEITSDSFSISADASDVTEGNNQLKLKVICNGKYSSLKTDPDTVKIVIE